MLTTIAIIAALMLVGAAIVQQVISMAFQKKFLQRESKLLPENHQNNAAVLMSVRGCDPSLKNCLIGVLNQEYKDYEVHLVVDSRSDKAWEFVHAIKSEFDHRDLLKIQEMKDPSEDCSLKCHSLVQAFRNLESRPEYIALLDADVTPHKTWLAELLGPLLISTTGGVTGNQWFEPKAPAGLGSLARSAWNSGSLILSINFSNPWAGSFAMRTEDLEKSRLIETWSESAVDDGPITAAVHGLGKQIVFAPSLIMVNREPCTFGYTNRWATRMLTWSRLHEKTFFITILHALFSNGVMLANFGLLFYALAILHGPAIAISLAALIISGLLSAWAYVVSRRCVEHSCRLRGEKLEPMSAMRFHASFWMIAPAHLIYGVSCLRAIFKKRIDWREIRYELVGGSKIRRLNYQPYIPSESAQPEVSI